MLQSTAQSTPLLMSWHWDDWIAVYTFMISSVVKCEHEREAKPTQSMHMYDVITSWLVTTIPSLLLFLLVRPHLIHRPFIIRWLVTLSTFTTCVTEGGGGKGYRIAGVQTYMKTLPDAAEEIFMVFTMKTGKQLWLPKLLWMRWSEPITSTETVGVLLSMNN